MEPTIRHRGLVHLEPCSADDVQKGDIVLCRVHGTTFLHRVKGRDARTGRVLIGSDRGSINGWTKMVFGRVTRVEN
jgi:hypothetical protein